jgi:hypothetical protein
MALAVIVIRSNMCLIIVFAIEPSRVPDNWRNEIRILTYCSQLVTTAQIIQLGAVRKYLGVFQSIFYFSSSSYLRLWFRATQDVIFFIL